LTPDVWDVVKVPFPYTNRPIRQFRPCLIVARSGGAPAPALLWVLMITSAENRGWPGDIVVTDTGDAGLPAPSVIRTAKIATIEADGATSIGCLAPAQRPAVADALRQTLRSVLEDAADP